MAVVEQPRTHYGEIIATNVSEAEYMEKYAAHYCEWVNGVVIKMSPASLRHNFLIDYLTDLFRICFTLNPIGRLLNSPFVMNLNDEGLYRTPLLPKFALHVPTLWQEPLPDPLTVVSPLQAMLNREA